MWDITRKKGASFSLKKDERERERENKKRIKRYKGEKNLNNTIRQRSVGKQKELGRELLRRFLFLSSPVKCLGSIRNRVQIPHVKPFLILVLYISLVRPTGNKKKKKKFSKCSTATIRGVHGGIYAE